MVPTLVGALVGALVGGGVGGGVGVEPGPEVGPTGVVGCEGGGAEPAPGGAVVGRVLGS